MVESPRCWSSCRKLSDCLRVFDCFVGLVLTDLRLVHELVNNRTEPLKLEKPRINFLIKPAVTNHKPKINSI